jgi:hypothetical protein
MSTVITKDPIMRRTIDRVVFDVPRKIADVATKMADKTELVGRLMRTRPHDCEDRRPRPGALAKGGAAQRPDRIGCSAKQTKILLQHNDVHRDVIKGCIFSFLPLGQGDMP